MEPGVAYKLSPPRFPESTWAKFAAEGVWGSVWKHGDIAEDAVFKEWEELAAVLGDLIAAARSKL